jgi:hypothetical protein
MAFSPLEIGDRVRPDPDSYRAYTLPWRDGEVGTVEKAEARPYVMGLQRVNVRMPNQTMLEGLDAGSLVLVEA